MTDTKAVRSMRHEPKIRPVGPKVLLLVGDWVEDYEAMISIQTLETLNIEVDVVSPGKSRGQLVLSCVHDFDRSDIDGAEDVVFANSLGISAGRAVGFQAVSERIGHAILITKDFDEVQPAEYDGLIAPGGRSPETLQLNETVLTWVRDIFHAGKPVAAMCHGIQILATAGILGNRVCTGHPCCRPQAELAGAKWDATDKLETIVDDNLITTAEWTGTPGMLRSVAAALGVTTHYAPQA